MPAGPAARVQLTLPVELGGSFSQDIYSVQYILPTDQRGNALLLTGTSTAVRRKEDLNRVFLEIAETLEIEREFFGMDREV